MGGIRDEVALCLEDAGQALGHLVERPRHLPVLARALLGGPRLEVARCHATSRHRQQSWRPGEESGEQPGHADSEEQSAGADPDQADCVVADLGVDSVDALRHPHRPGLHYLPSGGQAERPLQPVGGPRLSERLDAQVREFEVFAPGAGRRWCTLMVMTTRPPRP